MKKTIQLLGLILALAVLNSCYDSPDTGELSNELVVATDVDLEADFSTYDTKYYLSDTIYIVTNSLLDDDYITSPDSDEIISEIENNMADRGFTQRSEDPNDIINNLVNIAIATNIVRITNTGQTCYGWWGGYPGYWPPWGWGGGGYYYPYCSIYNYDTGSLIVEMANIQQALTEDNKTNIIWTNVNFGILNSNDNVNIGRATRSIDQAFAQSPYIQK